ncbi:hypothetical protein FB566_3073 [Stackebrandtia endophytica]|uniref:Uncharacterized protein n=1 Tax=Stackebrandtia endophytica TaxID=1496996 RepID=A0A543AY62_9ACTN|nr:hypothetical protein [Stackebrandtia endophytica]TQL77514.1 hypothetical protein FB566_3073 [Stackebrandtia endophytica]
MAASRRPTSRFGFERAGWWAALAVVAVMIAIWMIPAAINDAVPGNAQPVESSVTYTVLGKDGSGSATVIPSSSWLTFTDTVAEQLVFVTGAVDITVDLYTDVKDLDRFWERQARQYAAATPAVRATRHGTFATVNGLAGPMGTLTADNERGELVLLAKKGTGSVVIKLSVTGPPGTLPRYQTQFTRFLDTAEINS